VRVTFVNKYYWPPHLGGIEHHLAMLAPALARRPGMRVEAIVANEGRDTVREEIGGVDVTRLGRTFAYASTPVALGMSAAIRAAAAGAGRSDLFHLMFPYPWGETAWLSAGAPGPAVLTYHSDIVRQRLLGTAYRPLLRRVLERVDRIIVGSPPMVENSEALAPFADKCRVVPFGIETGRFAPTPGTIARAAALRAGHERPVVLFVGRLIYYKGVDVLVRAMAGVEADLVMIGRGPLEAELRSLAQAEGVADRVTFLPPVDDAELAAWYRAADVFALPSVARSEAYGLVQLEAHASGTPVVCTDLPTGVPWVNVHGETGLVVPVGDAAALGAALALLLGDDALRARMGAHARARALADFSVERMVERTLAVYDETPAAGRGVARH
jgi:glycosyltransferase involved in cell wall biosynthesis